MLSHALLALLLFSFSSYFKFIYSLISSVPPSCVYTVVLYTVVPQCSLMSERTLKDRDLETQIFAAFGRMLLITEVNCLGSLPGYSFIVAFQ